MKASRRKKESRILAQAATQARQEFDAGEGVALQYNTFIDAVRDDAEGGTIIQSELERAFTSSKVNHPEFWEGNIVLSRHLHSFWDYFCETHKETPVLILLLAHLAFVHEARPWLTDTVRLASLIQRGGISREQARGSKITLELLKQLEARAQDFFSKTRRRTHAPIPSPPSTGCDQHCRNETDDPTLTAF